MFGNLFSKKSAATHAEDQVWMMDNARRKGLHALIEQRLVGGKTVMLVCLNKNAFDTWSEAFVGRKPFHCQDVFGRNSLNSHLSRPGALIIALASSLPGDIAKTASPVEIRVLERHASRASDDALLRFADQLGPMATIEFHLSREVELLKPFATDEFKTLLSKLGTSDTEAISNAMLSRSIANAQKRNA